MLKVELQITSPFRADNSYGWHRRRGPARYITRSRGPATEQQEERQDHRQDEGDETGNLDPAIGTVANHMARLAIDQHLIRLLPIAVARQPHRQQEVLELHVVVPRIDVVQLLMITADILATESSNLHVHDRLGRLKTFLGINAIAFRGEAAEKLRSEVLQMTQLLRRQRAGIILRQAARSTDRHVPEVVAHLPADGRP